MLRLLLTILTLSPIFGCVLKKNDSLVKGQDALKLSLNDVSILIPYDNDADFLSKAPTLFDTLPGAPEAFLPQGLLEALDKTFRDDWKLRAEIEKAAYAKVIGRDPQDFFQTLNLPFRLVSLRLDPCANLLQAQGDDSLCLRQLRLVWQPFTIYGPSSIAPFDAAVHTIYSLDRALFTELLQGIDELRRKSGLDYAKEPLQTHPVISKEKYGPYFKGLLALLPRFAKASLLTQVAAFADTKDGNPSLWRFTAFTLDKGQYQNFPLQNVKILAGENPKFVQMSPESFFNAGPRSPPTPFINPPWPLGSTAHRTYLDEASQKRTREQAQEHLVNALRIENPRMHDIFNTDCVSCHTLIGERENAYRVLGDFDESKTPQTEAYKNEKWNLILVESQRNYDVRSLHNFSYFGHLPSISKRTVNESAEVLDYLMAHYGVIQ